MQRTREQECRGKHVHLCMPAWEKMSLCPRFGFPISGSAAAAVYQGAEVNGTYTVGILNVT